MTKLFSPDNDKKISMHVNYDKANKYIEEYGYSYKMIILLTHLMNHYYTKNIYPSMDSILIHILYIHDLLNDS